MAMGEGRTDLCVFLSFYLEMTRKSFVLCEPLLTYIAQ